MSERTIGDRILPHVPSPDDFNLKVFGNDALLGIHSFFSRQSVVDLKEAERKELWVDDWLEYQSKKQIFATLLSPKQYSVAKGTSFYNLGRAQELFGYYSPSHGYVLQVTFLGIFPFLMSENETLRTEAIERIGKGALFAFGLSERDHGSDIYSNETTLENTGGRLRIQGAKYYIGNAQCAEMVSVLCRQPNYVGGEREKFAFAAIRPKESPAYRLTKQIKTSGIRRAYVGSFEIHHHEAPASDLLSEGTAAWESIFGTVNLGKFLLGFGAIGICEHAFHEALGHLNRRILYGKKVIEMPHIRRRAVESFFRLVAMRLYAYRACDYVMTASADDRRYLLYCAIQKGRVSTEGVRVIRALSECINAKGFEIETYFEGAMRDIVLFPGLEGSTHVNLGIAAQFIKNYFFRPNSNLKPAPFFDDNSAVENPYLFRATSGKMKEITFPHFGAAYQNLKHLSNVARFEKQAKAFRDFLALRSLFSKRKPDPEIALALAEVFSVIGYGQLVAEGATGHGISGELVNGAFHLLVEDLARAAYDLIAIRGWNPVERSLLKRVFRFPATSPKEWGAGFQQMENIFSPSPAVDKKNK